MGADLVAMSGGKGLQGPQSTGLLAGRADLIEAARMQNAPNDGIGRGMKVAKEEIVGFIVALDRFVGRDHDAVAAEVNRKSQWIADQLQGIPRASSGQLPMAPTRDTLSGVPALDQRRRPYGSRRA